MPGILDQIIENKRRELDTLRQAGFTKRTAFAPRPVNLKRRPNEPLRLITEVKFRSPSAGALSVQLSLEERVQAYSAGGAALISILCDQKYFGGGYHHLARARQACNTPLLCKEFVLDEIQLDAALAHGADAVLLIVRCLPGAQLPTLIMAAERRGLLPVVEIFAPDEAARALDAGARVIGVNARDLDTLKMDGERAAELLASLPDETVALHLSGVKTPEDIVHIRQSGVDAALVGETLMRQDDPTSLLAQLAAAARPA